MANDQYDVIVFGATSFVGQIICRYLAETYGVDGEVKWAAAGRSRAKLEVVKASLGGPGKGLQLLVADATSEEELKALCEQTRVILSTVGPYALYGEPLIKACVETGTDYCDLTGEVHWIRRMLVKYEASAKKTGARIVNCCGFDSIPSDLGVYYLQQQAMERFQVPCDTVKLRIKAMKGGVSGGTVASMANVAQEAAGDAELRKELANPYSLCVGREGPKVKQPSVKAATFDDTVNAWLAPFVMAAINTRVVHRSNYLSDGAYGDSFLYDEAVITGNGFKGWAAAQAITAGIGGFFLAVAIKPSRWLLEKFVLPAPGEGPTAEAQERGFYDFRLIGMTKDGQELRVKVTGDRDPGYGSTAKMISEASICLAKDITKDAKSGGFWTPATGLGEALMARLQKRAGLEFSVL